MKSLYFVGIGGAGMAPLARIALQRGLRVAGSDRELSDKTAELARMGAAVCAGHRAEQLPGDCDLLIYSSAVPEDNPERAAARSRGIPEMRRGEFLARIAAQYPVSVAVSGSHGKTSTTAMLVWILRRCGRAPGYLIGGTVPHLASGEAGDGTVFVTEADESDGTHTLLHPSVGIIPNIEDDHAWSVGGRDRLFANFRTFAANCGRAIYTGKALANFFGRPGITFDADGPESFSGFLKFDAQLAAAGAEALGIPRTQAYAALADFPGVARRMTVRYDAGGLAVVEDYAHHPTEVAASLALLRERYPGRHLRVLFQPHRYARLARYFDRFAEELRAADSVVIAPVFAAWSESGPVGSAELAEAVGPRAVSCAGPWDAVAAAALAEPARPMVLAVLGAGDIERVFRFLPPENL